MPVLLYKIPLTQWIRTTNDKMNTSGNEDSVSRGDYWVRTYKDFGGRSDTSGSKGCPKLAAYGLWRLGRISNTGRAFEAWSLEQIYNELGKNATYAVLALECLEGMQTGKILNGDRSRGTLWAQVQQAYLNKLAKVPAQTEQGAVRVALALFTEGQILSLPG